MLLTIVQLSLSALQAKEGRLVDQDGRERIFHGVNVVVKGPPYHPQVNVSGKPGSFGEQDMAELQRHGLNGLRLGVMWPGVQPEDGLWDEQYLATIRWIVNTAAKHGIMTLVQFHQDLASERFCGDGIPIWLIEKLSHQQARTFPQPLNRPFHPDEGGRPRWQDCNKRSWGEYYFTYAVGSTFHKLYRNEGGLRDRFIAYWRKVASVFKGHPGVIAYQIINQPFAGDPLLDPAILWPSLAQRQNLQPFYDVVASQIRKVDPDTPICFEPVTWDNTLHTGFTHPPGGLAYANKSILCYHLYKPPAFNLTKTMAARIRDADSLKVAAFLSQFWFNNADGEQILSAAQLRAQSWLFWGYKSFGQNKDRGSFDLMQLTRTYTQAVAGRLLEQTFDPKTKTFHSLFKAERGVGRSEIFYYKNDYPNGVAVQVQPSDLAGFQIQEGRVFVFLREGCPDGQQVSVVIYAL